MTPDWFARMVALLAYMMTIEVPAEPGWPLRLSVVMALGTFLGALYCLGKWWRSK